jgi:hypothetical protein
MATRARRDHQSLRILVLASLRTMIGFKNAERWQNSDFELAPF